MNRAPDEAEPLARLREGNEQLRAELAVLRKRDQRYRAMLTSATEYALIATDLDGRITDWTQVPGWTEAAALGQSAAVIFTPEDRASGVPEAEMCRAVEQGRAVNERWHIRKDGKRFWGSGLMMPLRANDGAKQGYLKIMQDRSELYRLGQTLEQSEAQLHALFVVIPVGILVAEAPSGRLIAGNPKLDDFSAGGGHAPWNGVQFLPRSSCPSKTRAFDREICCSTPPSPAEMRRPGRPPGPQTQGSAIKLTVPSVGSWLQALRKPD